ncbi:MAG: hypothetical protein U5J63_15630 [Fodinibius sp.]|nr:hypothetical protein [Fodinibius sp.]
MRHVEDGTMHTIPLGDDPQMTKNGQWVGAELEPKLAEQLKAEKEKPKPGMALLNTTSGATVKKDSVQSFSFSNDGRWLMVRHHQSKEVADEKSKNKYLGTELVLRDLESGPGIYHTFCARSLLRQHLELPGLFGSGYQRFR